MTLKYIWRSFQPRLSFPRPFQLSLACFGVARSPSNSWASCLTHCSTDNELTSCFAQNSLYTERHGLPHTPLDIWDSGQSDGGIGICRDFWASRIMSISLICAHRTLQSWFGSWHTYRASLTGDVARPLTRPHSCVTAVQYTELDACLYDHVIVCRPSLTTA